jgi:hypothetical protein
MQAEQHPLAARGVQRGTGIVDHKGAFHAAGGTGLPSTDWRPSQT